MPMARQQGRRTIFAMQREEALAMEAHGALQGLVEAAGLDARGTRRLGRT
jgi:hypothetical protein